MIGGGVTIASGFVLGTTMAPSVVGTAAGTRMMIAGVTGTLLGWSQVIVGFSGGSMVEFPNTYTGMLLMPAGETEDYYLTQHTACSPDLDANTTVDSDDFTIFALK